MRHWRCWLLVCLLAGAAGGAAYAARGRLLPAVALWLDVGEPPQRADFVMVLAGSENTRPFVGAALVKAGLAQRVLLARVQPSPEVEDGTALPRHEINRRVLLYRGVPEDRITILGGQARSTFDEARALAAFLEGAPPSARVTVVTGASHTRRGRWIFRQVLGERARRVSFLSAPDFYFRTDRWWGNERSTQLVIAEYLKLAFYAVWYGPAGYWALGGLALVALVLIFLPLRGAWWYNRWL